MGDEKYECVMLKVVIKWFSILLGRAYWVFLGFLCLNISHVISVSND
jgi:hypothetical protein